MQIWAKEEAELVELTDCLLLLESVQRGHTNFASPMTASE